MPALLTSQSPFGNALRDARKERGLDQTELGQKVGVSQGTVSRWEKGGQLPEPHHMDVLCRDLGLTWEEYGAEVARRFRQSGCIGYTRPGQPLLPHLMETEHTLLAAA